MRIAGSKVGACFVSSFPFIAPRTASTISAATLNKPPTVDLADHSPQEASAVASATAEPGKHVTDLRGTNPNNFFTDESEIVDKIPKPSADSNILTTPSSDDMSTVGFLDAPVLLTRISATGERSQQALNAAAPTNDADNDNTSAVAGLGVASRLTTSSSNQSLSASSTTENDEPKHHLPTMPKACRSNAVRCTVVIRLASPPTCAGAPLSF